jgi:hypothetical protein
MSNVASELERFLKRGLRYSVALNQVPAVKRVLDPVYEAAARWLLRGVPLSARLRAKRYEPNLYFRYRDTFRSVHGASTTGTSRARPERLTGRQRAVLHTFATGETSAFAVGGSFLASFRSSPELGSFFSVWLLEAMNPTGATTATSRGWTSHGAPSGRSG